MKHWRVIAAALASAIVGALLMLALLRGGSESGDADEEKNQAATAAADRVAVENGEVVVTVDPKSATRNQLRVETLVPVSREAGATTYATVLDVRELVDLRNQLSVASAQSGQARARLAAANAEYARLKVLNEDNHNISDRVLQEAGANVRAEEANVNAADANANAAMQTAQEHWGTEIAHALASHASWIDDLLASRKVLVQVPAATQPPPAITLRTPSGDVRASYVSPAAHADPRIQGASWLYTASAGTIVPGMSIPAIVGSVSRASGVVVPRDAVVWTEGKSWIYVEQSANRYVRRAIDSSTAVDDGYFVTTLPAGTRIVVSGAQQLLSEESKPKVED